MQFSLHRQPLHQPDIPTKPHVNSFTTNTNTQYSIFRLPLASTPEDKAIVPTGQMDKCSTMLVYMIETKEEMKKDKSDRESKLHPHQHVRGVYGSVMNLFSAPDMGKRHVGGRKKTESREQ
jgi:hypothetical protein